MDYKQIIANLIPIDEISGGNAAHDGLNSDVLKSYILTPPDPGLGDYSFPCFRISKYMSAPPPKCAEILAEKLHGSMGFEEIKAVGGYLNFFIDKTFFLKNSLKEIIETKEFGRSLAGKERVVCIDYSSVNIAKPFHMGHLSTTAIGAALYRIYNYLGYKSIGINHLGDWGTQFGKLIAAYKLYSSKEQIMQGKIQEMLRIYVKFHEDAENNPSLNDTARSYFKKIEDGEPESLEIFNLFKDMTLREVDRVYKRLKVRFDSYDGESFFNDKMQPVLSELQDKNLLTESQGAKVVMLDDYNMPPCLLVKADGATLYATRDIAAAFYRKQTYNFYKCLYVVAYQQNLHFKQFFKVIELMGHDFAHNLEHVAFGMVSLESGAMSTRKGNVVLLEDVLDKCVEKAYRVISEKSPELKDKADVAEKVGTGAVIFSALINNRIKDIVFSYDRVLSFDGETGPYLQYSCVRAKSVIDKAGIATDVIGLSGEALESIEFELAKKLYAFKDILFDVIDKNEPSLLTRHLIDIAKIFNKFYYDCKILGTEPAILNRRLCLTESAYKVIKQGLELLGIDVPDNM